LVLAWQMLHGLIIGEGADTLQAIANGRDILKDSPSMRVMQVERKRSTKLQRMPE
jgi:hypothetical protein